jgi:radical SAM protein with 4Fe4S-binding SPASM domain
MNENFFDIKHKELLSACPPDVDENEWNTFRKNFKQAENFVEFDNPLQLDVELNGGCNMECPFCIHGYVDEKIPNIKMKIGDYHRIIDEAVEIGVKSLKLNYINEPMLRKDLEECIKYAKDKGILNVYMVTNGTALTKKRRESMLASGITKVFISLDATTSETYNKQRLSGQFDRVVNNINKFVELRNSKGMRFPLVRVSFLKNSINIHEAEEFKEIWEEKVDIINFQTMNEVPDKETGLLVEKTPYVKKGCTFPFKQLVVDHLGYIQPCCKLDGKKLQLGNISNMTLKEAWNGDKIKHLRKIHSTDEWRKHPVCFKCMVPTEELPPE